MTQKERLEKIRAIQNPETITEEVLNFLSERIQPAQVEEIPIKISFDDLPVPKRGIDYFTLEDRLAMIEEIQSNVKDGEQGPQGEQGIQGPQGEQGLRGPAGRDAEPVNKDALIKEIIAKIPKPKDISKDEMVKLILKEFKQPETSHLVSKDELVEFLKRGGYRGGGISSVAHDGTLAGDGTLGDPLRVVSSFSAYTETPTGSVDGVNNVFTTAHTINFIFVLAMNGQFIHPADYSFIGTTITFVTAPDISYLGLPFTVVYY